MRGGKFPDPLDDAQGDEFVFVDTVAEGADGLDGIAEVDGGHAEEEVGILVDEGFHFFVGDERAVGSVPSSEEGFAHACGLHDFCGEFEGDIFKVLPGPFFKGIEVRLGDKSVGWVLRPGVDDVHGISSV